MKTIAAIFLTFFSFTALAQQDSIFRIGKLELGRGENFSYSKGDSSLTLHIDTLVMKDKAALRFYGKKGITLVIRHAEISKNGYIYGNDGKNNGSDFDIDIRFEKLGSLYVLAGGLDANNGFRTHPNGDGGNVSLTYDPEGITPQSEKRRNKHYLHVDTRAGGYRVNPQVDIQNIYSRINTGIIGRPLANLQDGNIYSGSPGQDGKSEVKAK